jgi:hypothetical protein
MRKVFYQNENEMLAFSINFIAPKRLNFFFKRCPFLKIICICGGTFESLHLRRDLSESNNFPSTGRITHLILEIYA